MICADCARGADVAAGRLAGQLDTVAAHLGYTPEHEAAANHDRCQLRNADREPGQLPDCMCQHDHRAVNAEPEDVTHG